MNCKICNEPVVNHDDDDDDMCADCDALYGPCDACQKCPERGKDELTGCEVCDMSVCGNCCCNCHGTEDAKRANSACVCRNESELIAHQKPMEGKPVHKGTMQGIGPQIINVPRTGLTPEATFEKLDLETTEARILRWLATRDKELSLLQYAGGMDAFKRQSEAYFAASQEHFTDALTYYEYCKTLEKDGYPFSNFSPSEFKNQDGEIDTTPAKVTPIPPQRRAVILYNGETNYWEAWEDGQNQPAFLRNAISDHIGAVSHLVQRCMLAKFDVIEIHTNH